MTTNALILDCEQRLGPVLREILDGLTSGVSLVTRSEDAIRRLSTGLYDLTVLAGVSDELAEDLAGCVEEHSPGLPIVLVRGLVTSGDAVPSGAFAAVLDEPFSPRRFRDVCLAIMVAPEIVRRRLARRRPVSWRAGVCSPGGERARERPRPLPCSVANISEGGMLIEIPAAELPHLSLSGAQDLNVVTEGGELAFSAQASVAYVDRLANGAARVGLTFVSLEGDGRDRLRDFIRTPPA